MAVNGFQLSQGKTMDTGSRTKSPDDNREAMFKHEDTRNDALYGSLDLLDRQKGSAYHIGGGPGEREEVDRHSQVEEVLNYTLPRREHLVSRTSSKPKFRDNVKFAGYSGNQLDAKEVYLGRVANIARLNEKL